MRDIAGIKHVIGAPLCISREQLGRAETMPERDSIGFAVTNTMTCADSHIFHLAPAVLCSFVDEGSLGMDSQHHAAVTDRIGAPVKC